MVEVIWTDSALQDLDDIVEYISRDSERSAEITVELLFSSVSILEDHPRLTGWFQNLKSSHCEN